MSAHFSPNLHPFRFYGHLNVGLRSQNLGKKQAKVQGFDQYLEKNELLNTNAFSFLDQFSLKFA